MMEVDIPSRTFTWTLEYPLVIFFTPRITFDILAVGLQDEAMELGDTNRGSDGQDGSRGGQVFCSDNDSNAAAGGVVGQVA